MDYIREKPQFNSLHRRWNFIAVCKEVDENVKEHYNAFKDKGKPGLVYQSDNYEVYALTWDDVFKSFDLRHSFMLDKLNYIRDMILQELKEEVDEESRDTVDVLQKLLFRNRVSFL